MSETVVASREDGLRLLHDASGEAWFIEWGSPEARDQCTADDAALLALSIQRIGGAVHEPELLVPRRPEGGSRLRGERPVPDEVQPAVLRGLLDECLETLDIIGEPGRGDSLDGLRGLALVVARSVRVQLDERRCWERPCGAALDEQRRRSCDLQAGHRGRHQQGGVS